MINLNGAPEQRPDGPIPDGTYCKVVMHLNPGGYTIPGADLIDEGLFTTSKSSDAILLKFELTVIAGKYAKRKILYQQATIQGGKVNEKGESIGWNISWGLLCGIIDSALGLDPSDMSEEAQSRRVLDGFRMLDGIEFVAKIGIDTASGYNKLVRAVTPDQPEWAIVMNGGEVEPKPSGPATPRGGAPAQQGQPQKAAWQTAAAPARPTTAMAWSQGGTGPAIELDLTPKTNAQTNSGTQTGPAWLRGK